MFTVAISLVVLGMMTVILLMVEVCQYRAGRHLISRRRFVLRLAAGLLMLVLLAAVFVGLFVLKLTDARVSYSLFMGFWAGCIMVAVALVWVMLADLREVEERFTERQHDIWRDMARFISERTQGKGRQGSGAETGGGPPGDEKE
jgi:hypothetical protein